MALRSVLATVVTWYETQSETSLYSTVRREGGEIRHCIIRHGLIITHEHIYTSQCDDGLSDYSVHPAIPQSCHASCKLCVWCSRHLAIAVHVLVCACVCVCERESIAESTSLMSDARPDHGARRASESAAAPFSSDLKDNPIDKQESRGALEVYIHKPRYVVTG